MLLTINNLSIRFGDRGLPVVSDFNLSIQRGECVGLVGESGSGKTLTALAIMQLLPSTALVSANSQIHFAEPEIPGSVSVMGDDRQDLSQTNEYHENLLDFSERKMRTIRGAEIGMIFQDAMSALNPVFTIGVQLCEIIGRARRISQQSLQEMAVDLLHEVGVDEAERCFSAYPHQLSGGLRQRAMVAMALAGKPQMIIADEPTTALDVTIQAQVLALLKKLQQKYNTSLLFISHDLAVVSQLADRIIVMYRGKKVEESPAALFFSNPQTEYSQQLLAAIPRGRLGAAQTGTERNLTLLTVNQLKVYFPIKKGILKRTVGYVKAVDDVSFEIVAGKTLALVGESASGKTTTGRAIIQLLKPTAGNIILHGNDLSNLSKEKLNLLRRDMQIIFQDPFSALDPRMMVFNCICEGLFAQNKVSNKQEAVDKVNNALQQVDLAPDTKWRYPHEFSGGQRQRICIARALVLEPKLLILDEPTSALDLSIQMQVLLLLEKLQRTLNLTYLFITHNLSVVSYIADRVAVMYQGKIVEQGRVAEVFSAPQHQYTRQLIDAIPHIKSKKEKT